MSSKDEHEKHIFVPDTTKQGTLGDNATYADMIVALQKLQDTEKVLLESKQRYDRLVRDIPDAIFTLRANADHSLAFDYVSPRIRELMDIAPEAMQQDYRVAFSKAHPDDFEPMLAATLSAIERQVPFRWEGRFIVCGETRWMRISSDPTPLPDGGSLWNGLVSDITEHKQNERLLRQWSDAFNYAALGIAIGDANTQKIMAANPALAKMLGREMGEVVGDFIFNMIAFSDRERVREIVIKTNEQARGQYECQIARKNGEEFLAQIDFVIVRNANGQPLYRVATIQDITERKKTERLIREQEEIYRNLFNNTAIAMFRTRLDGSEILNANDKFLELVGGKREEVIGKASIIYWIDPQLRAEMVRRLKAQGRVVDFEFQLRNKKGEVRDCITSLNFYPEQGILDGTLRDITESKRTAMVLARSEASLRSAQRVAKVGSWIWHVQSNKVEWSDQMYCIFGLNKERFTGNLFEAWQKSIHPDDRERVERINLASYEQIDIRPHEYRIVWPDGTVHFVWAKADEAINDEQGRLLEMSGVVQDITEFKKSEDRLRLMALVFESTLEGIVVTDANNNIIEVNDAFTHITGYVREEVIGRKPSLLKSTHQGGEFYEMMWEAIKARGHWVGEIWNRRKNGEVYPEALTISTVTNAKGEVVNYVGIFSDITLLKQHEKQLEHTAHYDALTGIPNRVLLSDRMKQALAHARRSGTLLAVCYLDLDGFKPINDTMGHDAGDRILIEIAKRIEGATRGDDTVARLGGDEFVILLVGMLQPEECIRSLNRLLDTIARPIEVGVRSFSLSASIGVTLFPADEEDADTLLRHADQAMYVAKQNGKNRFYMYDPEHDQRTRAHQAIVGQVIYALAQNQFELFYQPKVELRTHKLVGAEALIRWRHPQRGLLAPGEFLDALNGSELEITIGEWVIATAIEQLGQWRQAGLELELSINISAYHLQSKGFFEKLKECLAVYPELPTGSLQIEILETAALEDVAKVTAIIEACHTIGVGFALDDFGTGYSSLSYLSNLPVNTLKIDQSFVRDMLEDQGDFAIVQGVIALAKAFVRETVAEGIETEEVYQALLKIGCEVGQGYGIARPMPEDEFLKWRSNNIPGI